MTPETPPAPSLLRRGLVWASDYAYATLRQIALVSPPWTVGRPRPTPTSWSHGDDALPEVVLLPGVYEHWTFLHPLGDALSAAGFRVSVVHGLGLNRREIIPTAVRLAQILSETPPPTAGRVLVAHSKGGLIGKQLLVTAEKEPDAVAARTGVIGVVAVATPFSGSKLASLMVDPSVRAFRPGNATIRDLGAHTAANARIVSVFGPWDPHIPEGSRLAGATNVAVPTSGHFRVLASPRTHAAVADGVTMLSRREDAPAP